MKLQILATFLLLQSSPFSNALGYEASTSFNEVLDNNDLSEGLKQAERRVIELVSRGESYFANGTEPNSERFSVEYSGEQNILTVRHGIYTRSDWCEIDLDTGSMLYTLSALQSVYLERGTGKYIEAIQTMLDFAERTSATEGSIGLKYLLEDYLRALL